MPQNILPSLVILLLQGRYSDVHLALTCVIYFCLKSRQHFGCLVLEKQLVGSPLAMLGCHSSVVCYLVWRALSREKDGGHRGMLGGRLSAGKVGMRCQFYLGTY